MNAYITYLHLLTALHTGGSANEGNLMGIAREVHTEFPYLPASSLRGKIRSELERNNKNEAGIFFGQKIKDGQQPTEGEVWFADATLLFFPIASLSHHLVWITCPLWLERWNRWLINSPLTALIKQCRTSITEQRPALVSFTTDNLYLQTALLRQQHLNLLNQVEKNTLDKELKTLTGNNGLIAQLTNKLVVLSDEDCAALVETGLQREVRVALEVGSKTVKGGSFRSEEAIPPEAVLFFPWGMKPAKEAGKTKEIRQQLPELLKKRLQFGGLEGLGRGWIDLKTIETSIEIA
ncbi:MAG: type III-B CRISPR module RAMP protein Cmr4 [Microcoleus sp. PH2017_10_PVI_O_A]|nr:MULTISPECIES: type III-B CRISPR module RAMP protein Cmr4 [unclassified Microcoleus]MCC3560251.1 type III-B CRISPR module RAMP protein Cmr4 [Microcoleus sp. PH2017_27_LUM_O_A]TAF19797.1 MAG: type III-B CRISPR module RAMP protein Cmr4 [Oscillatoriales cyanobacterium]MCC3406752.1 type III-B CRISPR module RAMP protein Cmr4 [Microcoleus sp. PH2017_10_PVI_O_A]MCC3460888.1 type III-B CRISPR module RAMP protein Cmr4 [Microcoleus sp. PH2017_11_PCY_U_A]MCC3479409.1 type III-B CRISPR module RAMP prote